MPVASVPPNVTTLDGVNPVPRMVSVIPPPGGPELCDRLVTAGTGAAGSFAHASVIVSPTCGGGTGYGPIVTAGWSGSAGSVQPGADACTSYQPEYTSQWNTPSLPVVSGLTAGSIPAAAVLTGTYGPAEVPARRIVTVAPLTGLPFVSSTVPLGSMKPLDGRPPPALCTVLFWQSMLASR